VISYTLFQNGRNFSILLFTCKLAFVASLRENILLNFEFKNEATRANLQVNKRINIALNTRIPECCIEYILVIAFVSKRVFVQNLTFENEFDLHENEDVGRTHFHMNGFARSKTRFNIEAKGHSEMTY